MRQLIVMVAMLLSFAGHSAWGAVQYTITHLGTLPGGSSSTASCINSSGQVAGDSMTSGGYEHAFLYRNGVMTDLGTLVGSPQSEALGMNDSGQVVGRSGTYVWGGEDQHAFLYSNEVMTDLGPGVAYSINAAGQVVGGSNGRPFIYSNGTMTYLNTDGYATGINDSGQVVGVYYPNGRAHAFLYSNEVMTDLDALTGNSWSMPNAINASGQVVGESGATLNDRHAFFYGNGAMTDLGTFGGTYSYASDINASGQIVGEFGGDGMWDFLYHNGTMINLNSLVDPTLGGPIAINDSGQIACCGDSMDTDGWDAVLLTPTPEPSSLVLFGIGAAGLFAYAKQRRRQAAQDCCPCFSWGLS